MTLETQDVTDQMLDDRHQIGANRPPVLEDLKGAVELLPERLLTEFDEFKSRTEELQTMIDALPDVVDDDNAGVFSDAVAQITAHTKVADSRRKELNVPILFAQRSVNGFFDKYVFDVLDSEGKGQPKLKQILEARLTTYQQDKVEAERKRRAEEEAEARRKAAEAERLRQEAERRAEQARQAEMFRIAEEDRKKREAEAAEAARAAEETRKREAAEKERLDKISNERQLQAEIARQAKEKAAREGRERLEAIERKARDEREAEARAKREAEAAADRAKAEAAAKAAQETAQRAAAEAERTAKETQAKAASLHTTRGDYGSSASLTTRWGGRIVDRDKMLESAAVIWPFVKDECLQQALNSFVKVHKGNKKLEGCEISQNTHSQVRG